MENLPETHTEFLDRIWAAVIERAETPPNSIHGPDHWVRVERNGLYVAGRTGADPVVVSLFAVFHDSCRVNDHIDPGHGRRGAELATAMRDLLDMIDEDQFELLVHACNWHTDRTHHDDRTIGACWDADRLDLRRAGIEPAARYFNTEPAIEIVSAGRLDTLDELVLRPH